MSTPAFVPTPCASCGDGAGAGAPDTEQNILCDYVNGEVVGSALAVYTYDVDGNPVGPPTFVIPGTDDPYVPQGTMMACPGELGCTEPVEFCFTTSSTGPVDHPGRQYDITLPINPGFAVDSMIVDETTHAANLFWTVFDRDGETFRQNLTTFMEGRLPADAVVTITNPNAGADVCGAAVPMQIHIECLRLDENPPELVELVYNGGRDLVVNPAYLTTPPTDLTTGQFFYLRRQDAGGTLNCTGTANRGWETNDLGPNGTRDFELWGQGPGGLQTISDTTPTPRGTPVQEITADINDTGAGPTIWQTFDVPAPGNFRVQLVHGARDPGEQHTIRLSTGDTNDTGPGDIINDVTNPPSVTNSGGPNAWTTLDQTVPLNAGLYTFSFQTTNPVGPNRGGLFTDMRVFQDVPNQRATATVDDDTCVVTVEETTTVQDPQWWAPICENGVIASWRNAETGAVLTNAQFWSQVPAPNRCSDTGSGGSGGGSVAANLVHTYPVCAVVGGVPTSLQRVVITDASGGALQEQFIGPDGGPVPAPTDYTIGSCADVAFVNDEILCDDNGPFLRKYVQSVNPSTGQGQVQSHRDFTLAGAVYTPVGDVGSCGAGQTLGQVCWTDPDLPQVPRAGFLTLDGDGAPVLYDNTGAVVTDYTIISCTEFTQQSHILCDAGNNNHQFLAWYTDSPVLGFQDLQWTLELDGTTEYNVVGPIVLCGNTCETFQLCDVQHEVSAVLPSTGAPTDDWQTLSNGVRWQREGTDAAIPGGWFISGSTEPDVFLFDRPVEITFSVRFSSQTARPLVIPPGWEIGALLVGQHTWDPVTRTISPTVSVTPAGVSTFRSNPAFRSDMIAPQHTGVQPGADRSDYGLITVSADVVTPFLRTICGGELPVDTTLDGQTPYVPAGEVTACEIAGGAPSASGGASEARDAEIQILCDTTPTRFLRRYVYDGETGDTIGFADTTLDGTTPFAPVGAVGLCTTPVATDFDFAIEQLCDNNGAFLRRFTFNSATGAVTTITNTNLAGANYAPVGTVGSCDQCCPVVVGEGCTNVGSGRYTAIRANNGTITLIDSVTGAAVAPAAIIACPDAVLETITAQHRLIGDADAAWTPGADVVGTLVSVTYTILSGTADVTDQNGTVAAGLPAGLTATWSTEDDANTLSGPQSIDAVGGQTYVHWTVR